MSRQKKKRTNTTRGMLFSPKQAQYGDGDGEGDEGESISDSVNGPHRGEIQMSIWGLNQRKQLEVWKNTILTTTKLFGPKDAKRFWFGLNLFKDQQ